VSSNLTSPTNEIKYLRHMVKAPFRFAAQETAQLRDPKLTFFDAVLVIGRLGQKPFELITRDDYATAS
jgi:hypothetical protein